MGPKKKKNLPKTAAKKKQRQTKKLELATSFGGENISQNFQPFATYYAKQNHDIDNLTKEQIDGFVTVLETKPKSTRGIQSSAIRARYKKQPVSENRKRILGNEKLRGWHEEHNAAEQEQSRTKKQNFAASFDGEDMSQKFQPFATYHADLGHDIDNLTKEQIDDFVAALGAKPESTRRVQSSAIRAHYEKKPDSENRKRILDNDKLRGWHEERKAAEQEQSRTKKQGVAASFGKEKMPKHFLPFATYHADLGHDIDNLTKEQIDDFVTVLDAKPESTQRFQSSAIRAHYTRQPDSENRKRILDNDKLRGWHEEYMAAKQEKRRTKKREGAESFGGEEMSLHFLPFAAYHADLGHDIDNLTQKQIDDSVTALGAKSKSTRRIQSSAIHARYEKRPDSENRKRILDNEKLSGWHEECKAAELLRRQKKRPHDVSEEVAPPAPSPTVRFAVPRDDRPPMAQQREGYRSLAPGVYITDDVITHLFQEWNTHNENPNTPPAEGQAGVYFVTPAQMQILGLNPHPDGSFGEDIQAFAFFAERNEPVLVLPINHGNNHWTIAEYNRETGDFRHADSAFHDAHSAHAQDVLSNVHGRDWNAPSLWPDRPEYGTYFNHVPPQQEVDDNNCGPRMLGSGQGIQNRRNGVNVGFQLEDSVPFDRETLREHLALSMVRDLINSVDRPLSLQPVRHDDITYKIDTVQNINGQKEIFLVVCNKEKMAMRSVTGDELRLASSLLTECINENETTLREKLCVWPAEVGMYQ